MKKTTIVSLMFVFILMLAAVSFASDAVAESASAPVAVTFILAALLAVSEALALIPAVKSNGIFDMVVNVLKSLSGK